MPRFMPRLSTILLSGLLLAGSSCGAALAVPAVQEEVFSLVDTLAIMRVTLPGEGGAPVRYYLSRPAKKSPLVLYIQGSGCTPPFVGLGTPNRYSTLYSWIPLAQGGRYAVLAVDKPYQSDESQKGERGSAIGCAGAFNQHFSYDAWLATLKQALRHALRRPEVNPARVLVVGSSEGAPMAAGLARAFPEVTDVVLLGANGPTQLYDFAANIYRSSDSDEVKLQRLQELDAIFNAISADPKSTGKFAWGHPYLRWSSFFAQSTAENLTHSKARVYLASGMQDNSVPILSTEAMYAQLRAQGRDVTFRRVPGAGHNLAPEGRPVTEAQKEFDAFITWFERR
ncbi:alpha/beta hydrolase family protein [Massilia niabensis]|uniref:Alpha/beta hydrolase family protein n=1 Tax=Massilia niabensis TaxID=544910 RepID=A0ABW0L186_9BURK